MLMKPKLSLETPTVRPRSVSHAQGWGETQQRAASNSGALGRGESGVLHKLIVVVEGCIIGGEVNLGLIVVDLGQIRTHSTSHLELIFILFLIGVNSR